MKTKKLFACLLAGTMVLSLAACGNDTETGSDSTVSTVTDTVSPTFTLDAEIEMTTDTSAAFGFNGFVFKPNTNIVMSATINAIFFLSLFFIRSPYSFISITTQAQQYVFES